MRNRYFLFGIVGARIHAVAMLSLAGTQLSASAKVIDVFRSAKVMASEMGFADICGGCGRGNQSAAIQVGRKRTLSEGQKRVRGDHLPACAPQKFNG